MTDHYFSGTLLIYNLNVGKNADPFKTFFSSFLVRIWLKNELSLNSF